MKAPKTNIPAAAAAADKSAKTTPPAKKGETQHDQEEKEKDTGEEARARCEETKEGRNKEIIS